MTHLSQRVGFTVPQSDNVVGLERYDKILAVAIEGHLSLEGKGVFSKNSTTSSSDIFATNMLTNPHEGTVPAENLIGQ